MKLKTLIFGKRKAAAKSSSPPEPVALKRMMPPAPWFLGTFIVGVCMLEEFSPTEEQFVRITGPLPKSLHTHVRAWTKVYLAWIFYLLIGEEYGIPFRDEALASVVQHNQDKTVTVEGFNAIVPGITYWFAIFNEIAASPVRIDGGQPVPMELLIADAFLNRDPDGPFFVAVTAKDPRVLVAEGLIECAQSLKPRLGFAVKVGAPAEKL